MDSDGLHRLIYEVTKYMLVFALILNRSFWKGGWTAWVGGLLVQVLQKSPHRRRLSSLDLYENKIDVIKIKKR